MCVRVVSILVEAEISRMRKCAFKSISNVYKMCRLARQLTVVHLFMCEDGAQRGQLDGVSVNSGDNQPSEYSDIWCLLNSHLKGTWSPSSAPSFPSYLLRHQHPLVKFPTQSLFAWKCQPWWQIFFIYFGLCNTLVYALSFFPPHGLLCVKKALYFHPEKTRYRFLA